MRWRKLRDEQPLIGQEILLRWGGGDMHMVFWCEEWTWDARWWVPCDEIPGPEEEKEGGYTIEHFTRDHLSCSDCPANPDCAGKSADCMAEIAHWIDRKNAEEKAEPQEKPKQPEPDRRWTSKRVLEKIDEISKTMDGKQRSFVLATLAAFGVAEILRRLEQADERDRKQAEATGRAKE